MAPPALIPVLYELPANAFNDIATGNNGYAAAPGYDWVTGLGTPIVNVLAPEYASNASSTTVASSSTSPTLGQPVTFTATVTPASSSGETGTVQFQIDGTDVGGPITLSGNVATYTTLTLAAGSHNIVAVYSGDNSFWQSTSLAFVQGIGGVGTSTAVTSSVVSQTPPTYGVPITFTATITAAVAAAPPARCNS